MLDLAIKYKEELQKKLVDTWFTDKYKFVHADVYCDEEKIEENTWNKHQFVSLDKDGNVIGYIKYNVNRSDNSCSGLCIYNFSDNKIVFGMDLGQTLKDIFGYSLFDEGGIEARIGSDYVCIDLEEVISGYGIDLEEVFPRSKYTH